MLIKAIQLLLSLSILVILHEFGHYLPAKLFRTRVEKFFLFFDVKFSLVKKKIGETVYGIGWLPLGGYVKIAGMVDESLDTESLDSKPEPWEFRSKPAWQRLIIMLGGIIVNVIFAFFLYIMMLSVWGRDSIDASTLRHGLYVSPEMEVFGFRNGDQILSVDGKKIEPLQINKYLLLRSVKQVRVRHSDGSIAHLSMPDSISNYMFSKGLSFRLRSTTRIESVVAEGVADKIGMKMDDKIISLENEPVEFFDQFRQKLRSLTAKEAQISFVRDGDTITKTTTLNDDKKLGIYFANPDVKIVHKDYSLSESIVGGISYGVWSLHDYVKQLKFLFTKKGAKNIGGLGSIGGLFPSAWSWQQFWDRTALLSIILAVMNLLPIPALDGGHVVFLLYEIFTKRKPRQKVLEYAQLAGIFILVSLMLYANGNDIYKFFIK